MPTFKQTLVSKRRFTRTDAARLPSSHILVLVPAPDGWMGDYDSPTPDLQIYGLTRVNSEWLLLKQTKGHALKTFKSISAAYRYFTDYPDRHDSYQGKIEVANIQDSERHADYLNTIGQLAGFAKRPPSIKLKQSSPFKALGRGASL